MPVTDPGTTGRSSVAAVTTAAVTAEPIDGAALRRSVEAPSAGAVVVFEGIVRDHDGGREVVALDYEAHPEAERILAGCCAAVRAETGLAVAAAHRVGNLSIGDVALYAVVAASHRRQAFDACELLVERIKSTVPIWKRQHYADGSSEWLGL